MTKQTKCFYLPVDLIASLQAIVDRNPQWRSINHLVEIVLREYEQQNKIKE